MDSVQYKGGPPPEYGPPSGPGFAPGYGGPPQPQYAPQQPQYAPQQPQVAIYQAPALSLGLESANIKCPNCQQQVHTEVKRVNTSKTHIWMFVLCIFGCWPCCLIPYCCNACRGAVHSCPSCKTDVGVGKG